MKFRHGMRHLLMLGNGWRTNKINSVMKNGLSFGQPIFHYIEEVKSISDLLIYTFAPCINKKRLIHEPKHPLPFQD